MNSSNNKMNGSSAYSSRSSSPDFEPIGDLPPTQYLGQPEERVPTPFPLVQQPIDQPIAQPIEDLPPLPLVMPLSTSRSPIRHLPLNPQPSIGSSSGPHPEPLSPVVHIVTPYPYALSGSSSAASFEALGHLIRRLRDDRRMNEEMRSRSVASGLYEFANMVMPQLPEYEAPIYDEFDVDDEMKRRQRRRQETKRFIYCMCVATGLISTAIIGQQIGNVIFRHMK